MIDAPEGTPYWAWMIVVVVNTAIGAGLFTIGKKVNRQEREAKAQAQVVGKVHHQVANEHNTNLRDDIDKALEDAKAAKEAATAADQTSRETLEATKRIEGSVGHLIRATSNTQKDVGGIRDEMRHVRENQDTIQRDLNEHLLESARQKKKEE